MTWFLSHMKPLTLSDLNTQYIITFMATLATTVNYFFFITFIPYELSNILSTFYPWCI